MRIPVVYSQVMVADSGHEVSPSSSKPTQVAQALRDRGWPVDFIDPEPATTEDLFRVHDPQFVKGVLEGRIDNGFGNRSLDLARTLPYTSGAMLTGAKRALASSGSSAGAAPVVAALCSGFHHAMWNVAEGFCTFNGLMVAAGHLVQNHIVDRMAIIDADYHYGNGTDDILERTGLGANVFHFTFGKEYKTRDQAQAYLERMLSLEADLTRFAPRLILYQAGADAHMDDPLGGLLTTEQMILRDEILFRIAKNLNIPVVFNLAGGYQRDPDGGIKKVIELHMNTFSAAFRAHGVEC